MSWRDISDVMAFVSCNYPFDAEDPFESDPKLSVTACTPEGDTPLHIIAGLGDVRGMELLIAAGAAVDAVGDMGSTPLHHAVMGGHPEAIRCLLRNGANRTVLNEFRKTPEDAAVSIGSKALKAAFDETAV
jgi:ankyrin repeat protein